MDNILKLILIGAGVIITCAVVGVGFYVVRESKVISSTSTEKLNELSSELTESDLTMYNGLEVSGSDVVNFIKKQLGDYSDTDVAPIYVNVITSLSDNLYVNGSYIDDIKIFTHIKYINPIATFTGKNIKDKNNVIVGVKFTQK